MNQGTHSSATPWLRVEGLAALVLSVALYSSGGLGWLPFALLLFVPDLSMLGYLGGPRTGAIAYNVVHTYTAPVVLGAVAHFADRPLLLSLALIWSAHIGLDRMLGYGLKLPTGFQHTHLGPIGRRPSVASG